MPIFPALWSLRKKRTQVPNQAAQQDPVYKEGRKKERREGGREAEKKGEYFISQ